MISIFLDVSACYNNSISKPFSAFEDIFETYASHHATTDAWLQNHCSRTGMSWIDITHHTTEYYTIPYHTIPYHTIPYHTIPYNKHPCSKISHFQIPQAGNYSFNRAQLINIGFLEALKISDYQCFVFHDVDHILENDQNDYGCPESPKLLGVSVDRFNRR
jgi:hypothetical protein